MPPRWTTAVVAGALLPLFAAITFAHALDGVEDGLRAEAQLAALASPSDAPPRRPAAADELPKPPEQHPLAELDVNDLLRLLHDSPGKLGSASVGAPNRGALFNGVQLKSHESLEVVSPSNAWGTASAVAAIDRAAREVARRHPGSHKLHVGDISARRGGFLRPHRSHQSGLDADLGYFYRGEERPWYAPVTADNLDRLRTWTLIKALTHHGQVEYIFVDRSIQELLREHAVAAGEDPGFIEAMFGDGGPHPSVIRHTWGHMSHLHVRFSDPVARETGRRLHPLLKATGKLWR